MGGIAREAQVPDRGVHWMFATPTAFQIMDANRGAGPGFDHMRILLSVVVIFVHSFRLSYTNTDFLYASAFGPVITITLPLFFALSGFLVTGSAMRNRDLRVFVAFRVLRIVPALATEVTLSALILGPLVTTVALSEYFADRRFLTYFGNIVGWIHFYLPGVFEQNVSKAVNLNLWTLHPELECYAVMAVMMVTRIVYHPRILIAGWVIAAVVMALSSGDYAANAQFGTLGGRMLIYYFVAGIVAYHCRRYIVINPLIMLGATVFVVAVVRYSAFTFIVPPFIVYMMVWAGMQPLRRIEWLQRGDYSYGLYLYGYPVQQTLVYLLVDLREWYLLFPASLALTLAIAMSSWHLVEKPALSLKRYVVARTSRPPSAQTAAEA